MNSKVPVNQASRELHSTPLRSEQAAPTTNGEQRGAEIPSREAASAVPSRLRLAQLLCRGLPPLLAQRLRCLIYPATLAYRDDYEFVVRAQTGSWFCGRTSDFHAYPFSVHGYYEWRNWAAALAVCRRGDVVVEIGANIGTETIGFSDLVGAEGRVHAFEPFPPNAAALRRVLALNRIDNVIVREMALGGACGQAQFVVPPNKVASGIGHLITAGEHSPEALVAVEVRTLDSLADEMGRARMLFMDTEGAEVSILEGGLEYLGRARPLLVLEASPKLLERAGRSLEALFDLLLGLQYSVFAIGRLSLKSVVRPDATRACNWICLPEEEEDLLPDLQRSFRRCGLCPCWRGLNPMTRAKDRRRE